MSTRQTLKSRIFALCCVQCVLMAVGVRAQDYTWSRAGNGTYGDSSAWLPNGIPGSSDRALFLTSDINMVSFNADYSTGRLMVDGSDVTFDLGNRTYNLEWTNPSDDAAVIGHIGGAKLLVTNGYVYSGPVTQGRNAGSFGALQISTGGFWEARRNMDWQGLFIAAHGNADLTVDSGGILRHGHGAAASDTAAQAAMTVIGGGSQWYVDGYFALGEWGKADLTISHDGHVRMGRCEMGWNRSSTASATIIGSGSASSSEWHLTSFGETSLTIGMFGRASVNLMNNGKLLNDGDLAIASVPGSYGTLTIVDSWADILRSMSVGGSLSEAGGRAIVSVEPNGLLTVGQNAGDRLVIQQLGTVHLNQGEIELLVNNDPQELLVKGRLAGAGMIWANVNNTSGTIAPGVGSDSKVLEIGGEYTQGGTASFEVELGGTEEEVDYGKLYVGNNSVAQLDGFLRVKFVNGFIPQSSGDTFVILVAPEGVSGVFTNANDTYTFSDGTFDVIYDGVSVKLTNFRAEPACLDPPQSDLNGDCKANMHDFAIMAGEWLDCGLWPSGSC